MQPNKLLFGDKVQKKTIQLKKIKNVFYVIKLHGKHNENKQFCNFDFIEIYDIYKKVRIEKKLLLL